MPGQRGAAQPVKSPTLKLFIVPFHVTVSGGAASNTNQVGSESLTVVRNGTGDYTLTLRTPAQQTILSNAPLTEVAKTTGRRVSATNAAIRFAMVDDAGTATDTSFGGALMVMDDIVAVRG